jgi:transposase
MTRTSKYINKQFGNWTCTHVGISRVQPKRTKKGRVSKRPGHQTYYYIFERLTSDHKALKMIRLSAAQALLVLKGKKTVEDYAKKKEKLRSREFIQKVSYSFVD